MLEEKKITSISIILEAASPRLCVYQVYEPRVGCQGPTLLPKSGWESMHAIAPWIFSICLVLPSCYIQQRFWALCGRGRSQLHMADELLKQYEEWGETGSMRRSPGPPRHPSPRKSWGSDLLGPDKQNEVTPGQGQGVVQAFRTGLPQTLLQMVGQSYTNKALTEMLPRK